MTQPHQPEQLSLPLQWYAPHRHDEAVVHQHFPGGSDHGSHEGVALVAFDPAGADIDSVRTQLTARRGANEDLARQLQNHQAQLNPIVLLGVRLHALIEFLLEPEERDRFELHYETTLTGLLTQCLKEVSGPRLLTPVAPPAAPNGALLLPPELRR